MRKTKTNAKTKTYKKKTYKKKTYKKKPYTKTSVNLGLGFPQSMTATLKYREYVFLNSTSGIMTNYLFSANNMFDVNITGTGHQPLYFDQYMQLYSHYRVIGSKIKVTFLHTTNSDVVPIAVGIFLNDDTITLSTNYEAISEQTRSKIKILGSSITDDREVMTSTYSARKIYKGSILANNALRGSALGNSTNQQNYNLYVQSIDRTSTSGVYAFVEIEYIAVFTELKDFAQS